MTWRDPHGHARTLVFRFEDGKTFAVPIDDSTTFSMNGTSWSFERLESLTIEDAARYELEHDALAPLGDLGRPPSEWSS